MSDTPKTLNGYDANKLIELMLFPLPDAAYKQHPAKSYLTTISPDYTRERLTKVFGPFGLGWGLTWEVQNTKEWASQTSTGKDRYNFAILLANFWYRFGDDIISFPVTGYSDNDTLGDAMKGARTSCISDGAKQLLFQLHIYKSEPYQAPKVDTDTGEVVETEVTKPPQRSKPAHYTPPTGEVIAPEQVAGFNNKTTKQSPNYKKNRNYLDDLYDEVQDRTDGYYNHKAHLYEVLGQWPKEDDAVAISEAVTKAVQHVSKKLDEKSAQEG